MFEDEFVVGDADHRPIGKNSRSDDAAAVHKRAVATAEVHDLELVSIVAADDRVLTRHVRVGVQADRVVAAPPDGGRIADFDLKRLAFSGPHFQFCWHKNSFSPSRRPRARGFRLPDAFEYIADSVRQIKPAKFMQARCRRS